jgi:hypothetical protein
VVERGVSLCAAQLSARTRGFPEAMKAAFENGGVRKRLRSKRLISKLREKPERPWVSSARAFISLVKGAGRGQGCHGVLCRYVEFESPTFALVFHRSGGVVERTAELLHHRGFRFIARCELFRNGG